MSAEVRIQKFPTLEDASAAANKISSTVGGRAFPVSLFKQGSRNFISAVFPVQYIVNELKTLDVKKGKGVKDVMDSMNRPIDPPHVKVTKEYILKNLDDKYILPPMTLNFAEAVDIYTIDLSGSHIIPGFMIVPYGVHFSVTDGQHRKKALEELASDNREEYLKIMNNGVSVMIVVESEMSQIHQDFADCSKTKPLPKSLISVYDSRNPANGLVLGLIKECPLFKDRVDATAATLSKNSTKVILVSQIRSLLKELMMGNSASADVEFEKRATELFVDSNSKEFQNAFIRFRDFINNFTQNTPILKEVSSLEGVDMNRIPRYRNEYLILNSAGLNVVGRVAYGIWQDNELSKNMDYYIGKLAELDWKKDSKIWQDNLVNSGIKGLKISNTNASLKTAVTKVKELIGIPTEKKRNDINDEVKFTI